MVVEFVTGQSDRLKVSWAKSTATRLRSLLHFLYVKRLIPVSPTGAVPSVASPAPGVAKEGPDAVPDGGAAGQLCQAPIDRTA